MCQGGSKKELTEVLTDLQNRYASIQAEGRKLDMSRGKPSPQQLDLSMEVLEALDKSSDLICEDGGDCRNYGCLDGIPEAKRLLAAILEMDPAQVFVGGGSSLNLMHNLVTFCWLHPLPGSDTPWSRQEGPIKFLCPVPGYDRHFAVSEHLGIENIPLPMTDEGPDMDRLEAMTAADPAIKGMWCVPKYSNPTGVTYSDETVRRLAAFQPAAKDFRIFWDNAYSLHDHGDEGDKLLPLAAALEEAGNEDRAFQFCSFAKITFGGGGIAGVGASPANLDYIKTHMARQMICSDKVNQLRHARYFKDIDGLRAHMKKHAALLRPKFELMQEIFARELAGWDGVRWTKPRGGYFISLDTPKGCAKRTVALCREAGLVVTPAGAPFPYGMDPEDRNIRIAPSFPELEELSRAGELFCLCVKIAAVEARLGSRK